jgi:hypothetical protein
VMRTNIYLAIFVSQDLWCKSDVLTRALKQLCLYDDHLRWVLDDVCSDDMSRLSDVEAPQRRVLVGPLRKSGPRLSDYVPNDSFEVESLRFLSHTLESYKRMIVHLQDANSQRGTNLRLRPALNNCDRGARKATNLLDEHPPPKPRRL